ncbi:Ig-like domain-containing protein [Pontibacter arcticus]|uniref:Por secretion system C-terminal sorting domain-containing protein n=1 Tax=Pontibacter arcticus TaxID=2080288 RepID=A0A364RDV4_9BACT|nr:Ig-like domain-containing protein [Pontibacter arcticus]RAU82425.1 hypothetical protein DP923_11615 [Pontibacter arcticus]
METNITTFRLLTRKISAIWHGHTLMAGLVAALYLLPAPAATAQSCSPISTLPCSQLQVAVPFNFPFTSHISASVTDRNGIGTGFKMIASYSGTRLATDGKPVSSGVPGYDRSKLRLANGRLQITTNKGIAFQRNNNQINTLGVRVDSRTALMVEATIVSPYYGTQSQQAGIWFGLNDKTFLKLVVVGNKLEFRKELNDVSSTATGNANPDARITGVISGLNTKLVRLRMIINPATNKAEAFYSTDGTNYTNVGAAYTSPAVSIQGMGITSSTAYTGIFATHRNASTPVTYSFENFSVKKAPAPSLRPYVTTVRPANGETNVALDKSVSVDMAFPSGKSINGNTVNTANVKLYRKTSTGRTEILGTSVNATAGGDAITLSATLQSSVTYEFEITDRVKDLNGYAMIPFKSTFKTTSDALPKPPANLEGVAFEDKVLITNSFGTDGFTTLVIGPDHRLYATTSGGKIERWDINADGTLKNHVSIAPFGTTRRLLIGLRFDPKATASNLIAWVSHSSGEFSNAPEWSGRISRVNLTNPSSPALKTYIVNLPRSHKDHATNSIDFGPDGALYFTQGSNTAMGAADASWGNRSEKLLAAAVLRLDIGLAEQRTLPIDVKTSEGGTYNPYASGAPLTIYATGVRNAYDLVWHSNGQLYVPTNGSAAGGNTPQLDYGSKWSNGQIYTGSTIPAMTDVRDSQNDYLFRVVKGGYYGHPNPLRNEYILNGGNPTTNNDPGEVTWEVDGVMYGYKVGTPKEPNYRGWSFDFGLNMSPNGILEYKSSTFGGKLKGKMLVCRFSGGDDLIILEPSATTKEIYRATEGIKIPGFRRPYANPLDIVEDRVNGNLYMSEYFDGNGDGRPQITLLKVKEGTSALSSAITTNMEAIVPENRMLVYPNPAEGSDFSVSLTGFAPNENVEISITDPAGRIVHQLQVQTTSQGTLETVIATDFAADRGIYIVRAQSESASEVRKLMIN